VGRPRGGRRAYAEAHVTGARNVARAADEAGAAALITVSALGVHRRCGAAYGETKAQAERIVLGAATPSCVVAPSLLFGEGSEIVRGFDLIARLPVPSALPIPIPDVAATFRPIHVDDAARAIVDLAGSPAAAVVPLVGPELLSAYEIAARALAARGISTVKVSSFLAAALVALLSRLKLPGLPAELGAMLALDNAGSTPVEPDGLVGYSRWVGER
jgi:NADH dehydrogenase